MLRDVRFPTTRPIARPSYGPPPPPHASGRITCEGCSHCCHYVAIEIDKPTSKRDYDNIIWYLLHDGVSVYVDHDGRWYVQFDTTCRALTSDGRCGVYEGRPQICREYSLEECVRHNPEPPERHLFRMPEDLERHLEALGVDWRWKRRPAESPSAKEP
jgi:Fe-S-cluster containining protein